MHPTIEKIYETGSVIGRSGKAHKVHSATPRTEGEFLGNIVRNDPGVVKTLEIGCAYGLSSLHICSALEGRAGAFHTIIDPFQSTYWDGAGVKSLEDAKLCPFELIEEKSEFALPKLLEQGAATFDYIFVDGWHTFDHTLLDCFYANRLLKVGGYLAIDDVNYPSVRRVVDYLSSYPCYELHGSAGGVAPTKSWRNKAMRAVMFPIPRRVWAKVLASGLYNRIMDDRFTRVVALKKVAEDERNWDWHSPAI